MMLWLMLSTGYIRNLLYLQIQLGINGFYFSCWRQYDSCVRYERGVQWTIMTS